MLFWAGNWALGRGVIETIPPVGLAFWRWLVASLILLPLAWPHVKRDWPMIRRQWPILVLLSVLGISIFNTMIYVGLHTTTALNGAVMQTSMPLVVPLCSFLFFRERLSGRQGFGIAVSITGVGILIARGDPAVLAGLDFTPGDFWVASAVFSYAAFTALLRLRPAIHPLSFVAVTFLLGDLILAPLYGVEYAGGARIEVSLGTVAAILYVAVFASVFAYLCWNRGVELIGANRAAPFTLLVPVFTAFLAVGLLGESLRPYHLAGAAIVFAGLALAGRRSAA